MEETTQSIGGAVFGLFLLAIWLGVSFKVSDAGYEKLGIAFFVAPIIMIILRFIFA